MATAKLNVQHDYLTLRLTFADKTTLNLTSSRWQEKVSGKVGMDVLKAALNVFTKFMRLDGSTVGQKMDALLAALNVSSVGPSDVAAIVAKVHADFIAKPPVDATPAAFKPKTTETVINGQAVTITEVDNLIQPLPPSTLSLQEAFDLVKNKKDWKARVDARIDRKHLSAVLDAVPHFTGTVARVYDHPTDPNKCIVRAAGYHMGPCGAH